MNSANTHYTRTAQNPALAYGNYLSCYFGSLGFIAETSSAMMLMVALKGM